MEDGVRTKIESRERAHVKKQMMMAQGREGRLAEVRIEDWKFGTWRGREQQSAMMKRRGSSCWSVVSGVSLSKLQGPVPMYYSCLEL